MIIKQLVTNIKTTAKTVAALSHNVLFTVTKKFDKSVHSIKKYHTISTLSSVVEISKI